MKKIVYSELTPMTPAWLALVAGLGLMVVAAVAAVFHMEHEGHWVTGMTNQIVWGAPHVFAVFLIVAASGALNVASMGSVFGRTDYQPLGRLSGLLAIALLAGGLAVLVLDLGRPDRLQVAMTHFNFKSIFAWNVILYSGFFVVVAGYLWTMMDWTKKGFYKKAAFGAFLWRLILTTGTGSIFGFLIARDAYGSAVMAPEFIAMSFAYGLAVFNLVVLAVYAGSGRPITAELIAKMGRLLGLFVAANLYFVTVHHVTSLYWSGHAAVESFILATGGVYTFLFWGVQILVGGVLPLVLAFGGGAVNRCRVRMASVLVILGGLAQVYVIIVGGQAFPLQLFPGMEMSSSFFDGEIHTYVPTLPEIVLGLGGIAIALLIVLIGASFLRFLPVSLAVGGTPAACCKRD
jgi:Ni/Fe-hydrogenase subunit HybB-like protein